LRYLPLGQELGNSEIEQSNLPFPGRQNVGGLQVTMNDEVGVRMLRGAQHLEEELQTRL
jgi:hypothetical protein